MGKIYIYKVEKLSNFDEFIMKLDDESFGRNNLFQDLIITKTVAPSFLCKA